MPDVECINICDAFLPDSGVLDSNDYFRGQSVYICFQTTFCILDAVVIEPPRVANGHDCRLQFGGCPTKQPGLMPRRRMGQGFKEA